MFFSFFGHFSILILKVSILTLKIQFSKLIPLRSKLINVQKIKMLLHAREMTGLHFVLTCDDLIQIFVNRNNLIWESFLRRETFKGPKSCSTWNLKGQPKFICHEFHCFKLTYFGGADQYHIKNHDQRQHKNSHIKTPIDRLKI